MPHFLFVTCQPDAARFLKRDIANRHPGLRFAFSRPGFVTFKSDEPVPLDVARPSPFARSWGVSLGRASSLADALSVLRSELGASEFALQAFARDDAALDELANAPWAAEAALRDELAELGAICEEHPEPGSLVGNIVEVDPGDYWYSAHRHQTSRRPTPGGRPPNFTKPDGAPSRVWAKIEEALWRSGVDVSGRRVVDIGCAPGGGTLVLLNRGAEVWGVDPAEAREPVAGHAMFHHLALPFEQLEPAHLPEAPDGFVFDVNLSPQMTLGHLRDVIRRLPTLRWGLVTLKVNKLEHVDHIDRWLDRLRQADLDVVLCEQLFHNRQELFVYVQRETPSVGMRIPS